MNLPFDRIVYISLRLGTTRRMSMLSQFKQFDIRDIHGNRPQWEQANNGRTKIPHEVYFDPKRKSKLEPTEIGCYASHYSIYQQIVSENWGNTLILEDDANFEFGFLKACQSLPDYDYISFGHASFGPAKDYFVEPTEFKGISKGYGFWFTHAYAITNQTAKLFLERLFVQTDSIDCQIAHLQKEINSYAFIPAVITQDTRKHRSTIIHTKNERIK